jgi:hypothetical protein
MSDQDSNRLRRRLVPAPLPSHPRLQSTVLSVECAEDEEVEWHWTDVSALTLWHSVPLLMALYLH